MRYLFHIVFLVLTFDFFAQNYPHDYPAYDFIDLDYNYIQFFDDSSNFELFFNKLDDLLIEGEGKVNIMHFGGSHIQADMWSDKVRQRFFNFIPINNGGRGLLFPFRLAKTNNPYYYKVSYTGDWKGYRNSVIKHDSEFGLTGITAKTLDSLSSFQITFRGDDYPEYDFNSIKVFHNQHTESFCLELISDTNAIRINNDSIGYTEFSLSEYQDTIEFSITKLDTFQKEFALYGLILETDDPGICYHSIGVNGASVPSYLRCGMFSQHLTQVIPDLVIFSIGINDAYDLDFSSINYESNYDSLIKKIYKVSPNTAILFTTNNDSYYKRRYPNKNAEIVREVMMKLAKKHGAGVWDMYGVMGGLGSIKTWEKAGLAKRDKIHLTKAGYEAVGDLLFEAIIKSYNVHLGSNN